MLRHPKHRNTGTNNNTGNDGVSPWLPNTTGDKMQIVTEVKALTLPWIKAVKPTNDFSGC